MDEEEEQDTSTLTLSLEELTKYRQQRFDRHKERDQDSDEEIKASPTFQHLTYQQQEEEQPQHENHLKEDNKGHALLLKMGWKPGKGLGKLMDGNVEPPKHNGKLTKGETTGVGKVEWMGQVTKKAKRREGDVKWTKEETEKNKVNFFSSNKI